MMPRQIMLYNPSPRARDMRKGKLLTLPKQAMSLQEMFRRFIRREPLPQEKPGVFIDGEHDLEKVARMDMVDQQELLDELKADTMSKKAKAESAYAAHVKAEEDKRIAEEVAKQTALQNQSKPVVP